MPLIGALAAAGLAAAPWPGDWRPTPAQAERLARSGLVVEMSPDPGRSSGIIHAAVDVRAPAPRIWELLTDCAQAARIVPFIKSCRVLGGPGPAGGWDLRVDEIETAFFLPRLKAVVRSEFEPYGRIVFKCTPQSELKVCDGAWRLEPTPSGAVRVTYASAVASPYPLPDFVIRTVLGAEMAQAMRTLRRLAAEPAETSTKTPAGTPAGAPAGAMRRGNMNTP
jgi:hypothetical protein